MKPNTQMSSATDTRILEPLGEFYRSMGLDLPPFELVAPHEMPEPYQILLVHDHDMTSALQAYHGQMLSIRVLTVHQDQHWLRRQVVLVDVEDQMVVEFGAICIDLDAFAAQPRAQILQSHQPLGAILEGNKIHYQSQPLYYFRVRVDHLIHETLGTAKGCWLFGRQNQLRNREGRLLAEVVEILPA